MLRLGLIGAMVIATFALCWLPFLAHGPDTWLQVVSRIFPVGRGLFEDKVANFWCSVSPVLRMKEWFTVPVLLKICTATTLAALLPSGILTLRRPSPSAFISILATASFSFFFFSFQVHEKSILLPLLPLSLLILRAPNMVVWQHVVGCFRCAPPSTNTGVSAGPHTYFIEIPVCIPCWFVMDMRCLTQR